MKKNSCLCGVKLFQTFTFFFFYFNGERKHAYLRIILNIYIYFCFNRERERTLAQAGAPVIQPQRTDGPRFTGGGFNLKSTKTAA